MARCKEIPEDFMAANSQFSEKFPKTINEVTSMVSGNTSGMSLGDTYHKNLKTINKSNPLPANSEIYNQIL